MSCSCLAISVEDTSVATVTFLLQMSGDSPFHDGPTVITPMPSINRTLKPANKSFLGESYVRRREFDIVSSVSTSCYLLNL